MHANCSPGTASLSCLRCQFKKAVKAAAKSAGGFEVDGKNCSLSASASGGGAAEEPTPARGEAVDSQAKPKKAKISAAEEAVNTAGAVSAVGSSQSGGKASAKDLEAVQKWRDDKLVQASEEVLPTLAFSDPRLPKAVVAASCGTFAAPTPIQVPSSFFVSCES